MALITTYQDLFPSSTIMRQAPGNGTITIPGAGDARLYAPNSVNCEFYIGTPAGKAPVLYERLGVMWQSSHPSQPLFLEAKLSVFTGTTNLRIAGLCLFTGLPGTSGYYSYQFGWYKNDAKMHVWYDYPTTEVELFTAVTAPDPATTPIIFRIYWNPYARPLYIGEISTLLQSDALAFAFSSDNGVTWTSLGARARDFNLVDSFGGIYCRKWETTAVNAQADFAYFKAQEYDPTNFARMPDAYGRNQVRSAFEDAGVLLNESSAGARFDSPSGIKDSATIRDGEPRASFEDAYLFPAVAGKGTRFDYPQNKEDYPLPPARSSIEEALFVQLDATDYIKGKYDADGKEYLGNYAAKHVLYYDATLDPWHTHGAGFYGFGRDGKAYFNGVECGPGALSAGGVVNKTAWSMPGTYLDVYPVAKASEISVPVDGTVRLTPSGTGAQGLAIRSSCRWCLTGDFDVQVDYNIVSAGSAGTDGGIEFYAWMDNNNGFYARRRMWGGNFHDKDVKNNGSYVSYAQVATSMTSGKLRLVRAGSVVSSYYWTGSAWAQIGGNYTMTYARPAFLHCGYYCQNTPSGVVIEFSNFQINSGTTSNLSGWAREVAGTYRGSLAEFPQHALIVSSGNSLDIIDVDTNKLWMSFRGGATKLLGGDSNYYVPQVAFKDGTLLLCYRTLDTVGTVDGYGYWIDFTLDFARCHRGPSYNDAGFYYNVELTSGVWPRDSANGAIAWRNSNRGESASHYDNWQFQNNRANWADLLHDSGYQYRLIANNGGVYAAKWQRWRYEGVGNAHLSTPDYGISTRTEAIRWVIARPTSKDLLYHNRVYLWISHWSNWGAVIGGGGGTWTEDHEYLLAGTVDGWSVGALAQDAMALDDSAGLLFYARDQGVYVMNLTTGASTLFYGKVGSGATHEVLPEYGTVSSVKLATDGATSLLLVGMARPDRIWAVNRATHAIYWRGFQDDGHQPLSMAVGA